MEGKTDIGSDSEGILTDGGNKKRERDSPDIPFGLYRSKRTHRTPNKLKKDSETEMDELKDMMKEMMTDLKSIRDEQSEYRNEMKQLREENKALKNAVKTLETRLDIIEKRERKCNIVIKGLNTSNESTKSDVHKFLKDRVGVDSNIRSATKLGKGEQPMILVRLENAEEKQEIMKKKNKLWNSKIFIDNDLTYGEREVQAKLRNIAKEKRTAGTKITVKYQKLIIDGKVWVWDRATEQLVAPKN